MTGDEVKQEDNIIKIAQILKKIHSIEYPDRICSVFDLLEGYLKGMKEFKVKEPEGLKDILIEMEHIRARREKDKSNNYRYTHNDILDLNLIINGDIISVIDWELSGVGDPYMDLASLPYSSGFQKEQEILLLKEYFGYYEEDMYYHLKSLKYIGLVREVLWALFYGGLQLKSVNHDMDYYGAANYALDRLKQGFLSF
jgi:thiamine kinase-like enzyme